MVGALKFAIGVPTLVASLVDLRNPAFNGNAGSAPGHSATQGWSFVAASSQFIDAVWQGGASGSLSSQNSVHLGARVAHYAGSGTQYVTGNHSGGPTRVLSLVFNGTNTVWGGANDGTNITGTITPLAPAHYVMSRTGASAKAVYRNGALLQNQTLASTGVSALPTYIGAFNSVGAASLHFSGRITAWHAGGGLDASQIAQLDALIDAYASAVGET